MSDPERNQEGERNVPVHVLQDFINTQNTNAKLALELVDIEDEDEDMETAYLHALAREECVRDFTHILRGHGIQVVFQPEIGATQSPTVDVSEDVLTGIVGYFSNDILRLSSIYDDLKQLGLPDVPEVRARMLETSKFVMDLAMALEAKGLKLNLGVTPT